MDSIEVSLDLCDPAASSQRLYKRHQRASHCSVQEAYEDVGGIRRPEAPCVE